jgi:transposase InsO family protein
MDLAIGDGTTTDSVATRRTGAATSHGSAFTQRARESGLVASMGSIGDCENNAVIESFWARVQVELHNRRRRHSALGMRTPIEFERLHNESSVVA